MHRTRQSLIGSVLLAALAAGCGSGGPSLVATEGTVTGPDGKPLPNVLVQFSPVESTGTKSITSSGVTDQSGKFVLTADTGGAGAVPGKHKVTLVDNAVAEVPDEALGKSKAKVVNRIPSSYSSPTQTPLEVTVEAGKKQDLNVVR